MCERLYRSNVIFGNGYKLCSQRRYWSCTPLCIVCKYYFNIFIEDVFQKCRPMGMGADKSTELFKSDEHTLFDTSRNKYSALAWMTNMSKWRVWKRWDFVAILIVRSLIEWRKGVPCYIALGVKCELLFSWVPGGSLACWAQGGLRRKEDGKESIQIQTKIMFFFLQT